MQVINFSKTISNIIFQKVFLVILLSFLLLLDLKFVKAEPYADNTNAGLVANRLCTAYIARPSTPGSTAGGGASVPVSAINIGPAIFAINRATNQTVDELKIAHFTEFCTKSNEQARSIVAVKNQAFRELTAITSACGADTACTLANARDRTTERLIQNLRSDTLNPQARDIERLLVSAANPDTDLATQRRNAIYRLSEQCQAQMRQYGYITSMCREAFANGAYPAEIIRQGFQSAQLTIASEQSHIQSISDRSGGLQPTRICRQTRNGANPATVDPLKPECLYYEETPIFFAQEAVRNIIALPYNQAFSAAGILGPDGGLANISTRVREGNLFDENMTSNFGSQSGQSGGSPTGGAGNVLGNLDTGGSAAELEGVKANYIKLIGNLNVAIDLYEAAKTYYASTTSPCVKLPVANRASTITAITKAQKIFKDYKTNIEAAYEKEVGNPTQNHTAFINKVNTDLRDNINQAVLDTVLDAVKQVLQVCVDAAAASVRATATSTASTTTPTSGVKVSATTTTP